METHTSGLVKTVLHGLELSLKFLVLHGKSAIGILQQGFQILYPLVSRKKLPFGNPGLLFKRRVLIDKLRGFKLRTLFRIHVCCLTCFWTSVNCSRFRSRNAIFFC